MAIRGNGTGLLGEYYDDLYFTNLALTRTDTTVDFNWGDGSPTSSDEEAEEDGTGIGADTFSVRWTGQIEPLYSETYTFSTWSDDGVRLWVDGQLLIDNWTTHAPQEDNGSITLEAGRKYDIRLEYFEDRYGSIIQLLWSSPSQSKEIIPQSQLYAEPEAPGTLEFSAPSFSVSEDGTPIAAVTVTRTGGDAGVVGATLNLSPGTATNADYNDAAIDISFADGESAPKTIAIPLVDDDLAEEPETVNLTLVNPTGGATLGTQDTATLTIADNDSSNGTGLRGEYYNNADFTNLTLTRTDATVDFDWGNGSPSSALASDTFSVRWTGQIEPLHSETYTFSTWSDDGVRLWIDGQLLIDNWTVHAPQEDSGSITLEAGQKYDIRLEYFENRYGSVIQLLWSSPSQSKEIIPQSQLYAVPEAPGTLEFSAPSFTVSEDGTPIAAVTVTRTGGDAGAVGATLNLSPGTATTADYNDAAINVSFADGESAPKTIAIPLVDDDLAEEPETVNLTLVNPTGGATLGIRDTATLTIDDNDSGNGTGLWGKYYNNSDFTDLALARTDATVDFNWGEGSPDPGEDSIGVDTFSVRWLGQVEALHSETYTFSTWSDDGVRLWVDGQLLIDNWTVHAPQEDSGSIALEAGQKYDIQLEYFENRYGATIELLWSSPSQSKQIIPQSQLYPGVGLFVSDATVTEGDADLTELTFTVSLSTPSDETITVDFATESGTATEGVDYIARSGTLTFAPGTTEQTVTVQVQGDADIEPYEDLYLNLSNSTNAIAVNDIGKGTIRNDDLPIEFGFPDDVSVANVRDYGAKGDGVTDDTEAIQRALAENRAVYFPDGTYLVSDTLLWSDHRRLLLQGESQDRTIIKLKDNLTAFNDPTKPKPTISTFEGISTGQAFQNSIYNLTVDVGSGNSGAIGIRFTSNNQGGLRDVTIRSSDPANVGKAGLAMTQAWPGPALIKNVRIEGFDYGIQVRHPEYSNVFENIHLKAQRVAGINNSGNILTIRGLTSENSVPVIQNVGDSRGTIAVIDGDFSGGSASHSAIDMQTGRLYARNIETSGYQSALKNGNTVVPGSSISEYIYNDIYDLFPSPETSLHLPIEETPEIRYDLPVDWTNVTDYGANGEDSLDDTAAIQKALDSGKSTIYFPGGNFIISDTLRVSGEVRTITGASYDTVLTVDNPLSDRTQPVFRFEEGNQDTVVLERFFGNYGGGQFHWVEQASSGTLVLRNFAVGSGNAYRNTDSGRLFIEDVTASGWVFDRQEVWARQLNPEGTTTKIVNNGGSLWILGLKTEKEGTVIKTTGGGKTEVLGGLIYPAGGGDRIPDNQPAFINDESHLAIVGVSESRYGVGSYDVLVRETRDGTTRSLLNDDELLKRGQGFSIPLYVGSDRSGDELVGDAGVNVLEGGFGSDRLIGGGGADIFVYGAPTEGTDAIADFESDDSFLISAGGFGGGLTEGIALDTTASATGVFVRGAGPRPSGAGANFLYDTNTGVLRFDLDGTGPGVAVAIAVLEGAPTLEASQFTITS